MGLGVVSLLVAAAASIAAYLPPDPALLAPGPDELASQLVLAEDRVGEAETIGRALARLQNRFAELSATKKLANVCGDAEARSISARSRALGRAYRDAVQSARAQSRRLERVAEAPTVVPALDAAAKRRCDRISARVAGELVRWRETRAWHHRYIEPAIERCASKIVLAPAPGLAPALPCAAGECPEAVALIGVGGGRICPGGHLADGSVVIARDGHACYGADGCSCVPRPVLPGAVLGP